MLPNSALRTGCLFSFEFSEKTLWTLLIFTDSLFSFCGIYNNFIKELKTILINIFIQKNYIYICILIIIIIIIYKYID